MADHAVILAILKTRIRSFVNSLWKATPADRRRAWSALCAALVAAGLIGGVASGFVGRLAALGNDGVMVAFRLLDGLPAFCLFTAFWLLVLSAITVCIQQLYLNQEMQLLLAAPTPVRGPLAAKLGDVTLVNASLFLLFGGPALFAYAVEVHTLSAQVLLITGAVLVAFSVLPSCVGALLAILLMRVLPAGRARELMGAAALAAFTALYLASSMAVRQLNQPDQLRHGARAILDLLASPVFHVGPWSWASDAIVTTSTVGSAVRGTALLLGSAALSIAATLTIACLLYYAGWSTAQEASGGRTPRRISSRWERWLAPFPGPIRAGLLKDLRTLFRDIPQLSMLFVPVAVIVVFLTNVSPVPETRSIPSSLLAVSLQLVFAVVTLRLAMSGFTNEQRAFWMQLGAPVSPRTVLTGKMLYTVVLSAPLAYITAIVYGVIREAAPPDWAAVLGLTLASIVALSAIGVGGHAAMADLGGSTRDSSVMSAVGRLITAGCQIAYVVVVGVIVLLTWFVTDQGALARVPTYVASSIAIALLTYGSVATSLRIGARRLRRIEW